MKVNVTVLMDGRETVIPAQTGETILEALARAGIAVSAPCGGLGRCRKCAVRATGELACEDGARLDGQTVLACRTRLTGDACVRVSESKAEILKTGVSAGEETDGEAGLGVSVDVGTTTLAAYLVERSSGRVLASDARLNPQRPHGADVISRLSFAIENEENAALLQREILAAIDGMTRNMLEKAGRAGEEIRCRALVGNTVMMHLLGGYPARPLAFAPFTPAYTALHEKELGGVRTILGGCISGYVGADTLAAALACGLDERDENAMLIDIGTNGEIMLKKDGRYFACSCAAGPAFEGAHIACGTGAVAGAIDHARVENGEIVYTTIGGGEATGICGSGLIDLTAALLERGDITPMGRMAGDVRLSERVYLARSDIREVQLAKAAIASGIRILAEQAGAALADIERVYLAGGFGNFIGLDSACRIGLLPAALRAKIVPVGNAAGSGSVRLLVSEKARRRAEALREATRCVELAATPDFNDVYTDELLFEDEDDE
ncbi:MAG: ASKHA domain-containing protein [Clostridia bacterium]|nr:ASKHA domain-containing protein [Clostridia bacterium]